METVILIIYAVASYWATNKVLYEGKCNLLEYLTQ